MNVLPCTVEAHKLMMMTMATIMIHVLSQRCCTMEWVMPWNRLRQEMMGEGGIGEERPHVMKSPPKTKKR